METHEITPVQRLVLSAAGKRAGRAEGAIALDGECARIARAAREPMMAQIRLAWWRDGLASADALPAHRSPMMDALRAMEGFAEARAGLIAMIDGWEELILWGGEDAPDMLRLYAEGRGGGLFAAIAPEREQQARIWGRLWALWDLAGHVEEADLAEAAIAQGRDWARELPARPPLPRLLAMLGGAARRDLARGRGMPPALTPGLYMRLLRLQIFGR